MRRALQITAVLFVLGVGTAGLAAPASAAATTTTTTTTKAATATNDKTWPWLSAAALGLGVVAAVAVLVFVRKESEATEKTIRMALRLGRATKTESVHTFDAASEALVGKGGAGKGAGATPVVQGSSEAEVGHEYLYTAKAGTAAAPASWKVEPADAAEVTVNDAGAHVTPQKAGTFTLTATVAGSGPSAPKQITATAPQPPSQTSGIPFVGEGWGSIVVAMVVAALVTALGFVRVLSGEALAGFYGALIGYVFHKAASEKSNKGATDSSGKGPQGGGGG